MGAEFKRLLHGIKIFQQSIPISHMLYVDDVLLFGKANLYKGKIIENLTTLCQCLRTKIIISTNQVFSSQTMLLLTLKENYFLF